MAVEEVQPHGEKIRQAVRWICEMVKAHPEKKRADILREAGIRFDLSPKEGEFIETKLSDELGPAQK